MATLLTFFFLLLLPINSLLWAPASASSINTNLNAYEVLQSYNFPVGILPKGVIGYDLDYETGKFAAYLNGTCQFSLEGSYQLNYQSTIRGYISENELSSLQGVSVKVLFVWINIVEVTRVGDNLEFSVGLLSADFAISNFDICAQCGCGLDCVGSEGGDEERVQGKVRSAI